jgi:hypothetical protein
MPTQEQPQRSDLAEAAHSATTDIPPQTATHGSLSEDSALALLARADLPASELEALARNREVARSRKIRMAIVMHARTPRHVSLPLIRNLFTQELMKVALHPLTPADIKRAGEEVMLTRLPGISAGERLTLARRASGRVAAGLLCDAEPRIIRAALDNGRLVEADVVKALMRQRSPAVFVEAVCHHPGWSVRREVRKAALRNQHTPLGVVLQFARGLHPGELREILNGSNLRQNVREYLLRELERLGAAKATGHS